MSSLAISKWEQEARHLPGIGGDEEQDIAENERSTKMRAEKIPDIGKDERGRLSYLLPHVCQSGRGHLGWLFAWLTCMVTKAGKLHTLFVGKEGVCVGQFIYFEGIFQHFEYLSTYFGTP